MLIGSVSHVGTSSPLLLMPKHCCINTADATKTISTHAILPSLSFLIDSTFFLQLFFFVQARRRGRNKNWRSFETPCPSSFFTSPCQKSQAQEKCSSFAVKSSRNTKEWPLQCSFHSDSKWRDEWVLRTRICFGSKTNQTKRASPWRSARKWRSTYFN